MLPGRTFTPEDALAIFRRRFWWLVVPFAVIAAGTALVARYLPNRYRSEAVILVIPQQVPESYVRSTVSTRIEDRLDSIQQQILSRTRLERIIEEFNLYPEERRTGIMEDVVEDMRTRDMKVTILRGDSFKVSYEGEQPRLIARVTDRLASLFIEESLKDRAALTEGTSQFLEGQLEDARRRLIEQEKKLEDYRRRYSGQLPTQLESNLTALQNVSMQVQSLDESINRDHAQRLIVERQLSDLQGAPGPDEPLAPGVTVAESGAVTAGNTASQLAAARATLASLQQRGFTRAHPDVQTLNRLIDSLQAKFDAESLSRPVSASTSALSPAERARLTRIQSLEAQRDQLLAQVTQKETDQTRLRALASTYQAKIDQVPTRESELTELTRDYGTIEKLYNTLLAKKEESNIAANLERRQIGEQFRLLDPARVAEKPVSPNRPRISAMGMLAGLCVGVLIVGVIEYRDTTFKAEDEVHRLLQLPVLAVVPMMRSNDEQRRLSRRSLLVSIGLGSAVAGCMAVLVYTFVR